MEEKQRTVSLKFSCQSHWSEQMDSGYRANGQRWVMNVVLSMVLVMVVEKGANESLSALAVFERLPLAALLSFHNSRH